MSTEPNIIWISIDSIRLDRTSLGGHHRNTTPRLSEIADMKGVDCFSNCIAHGFSTRTSTASMFTARQPGNHGVSTLGNTRLDSSIPTIAELLSNNGYHTSAVSTNAHISNGTGLDRGFGDSTWISPQNLRDIGLKTLVKFGLNIRRHSIGLDFEPAAHSSEYMVNDLLKEKIRKLVDCEPFFLFAHYNGPHTPYYPPLPWISEFLDEFDVTKKEAKYLTKQAHYFKQPDKESDFSIKIGAWDEKKQSVLRALYDAEVKYTDYMVGKMFDYISEVEMGDTIIIITSDHGELLGEKNVFIHGRYPLEALINVPLLISGIKDLPKDDTLIQHADVTYILSKLTGVSFPQCDGIDLRDQRREHAVTQAFNPSIISVRSDDYKYVDGVDEELLYKLPNEKVDVKESNMDVFTELQNVGNEINRNAGEPADLSTEAEQQLKDLGYKL